VSVVLVEGLGMFRLRVIAAGGKVNPYVLYENNFCWVEVWELIPEGWDRSG
jgi:hypothetical protein